MNEEYLAPLIQDRDRWQAMADHTPTMLWISDTEGVFTGFNAAWLRWRGRELHQEVGIGWRDGLHADDHDFWTSILSDHLASRQNFTTEIRIQDAAGHFSPVMMSARPWFAADGSFGGFVGSCQVDQTDHHPPPMQSNDVYRATIEALQEGVIVTDEEGRLLTVNEAAAVYFGVPRESLIGHELLKATRHLDVVDEHGQPVALTSRPTIIARRTRQPVAGQLLGWHVDPDGVRWFTVHSRPLLNHEGSVTAVVTSFLDVTVQKHAADNARHEARHDALTGLVNRWGLRDVVRQVLERSPRRGEDVALAYCDLDNFKVVNDSIGHAAGDELLREVALRIKECVRSSDVVARIGGDEVIVVLDGVHGLAGALTTAEKIRHFVARPFTLQGQVTVPHLSIGVAMLSSFDAFDETLSRADEAMYEAKAAGRNQVRTLDE